MNIIILAGGQGSRLGYVDKAQIKVNGQTFLNLLLDNLQKIDEYAKVVLVSPHKVAGIPTIYEHPPLGGPLAGIEAACHVIDDTVTLTAILAVDAPYSPLFLPHLQSKITTFDVAVTVSKTGFLNPLCCIWRTSALKHALSLIKSVRNQPAKLLFKYTDSVTVVLGNGNEVDYDTASELSNLGQIELPPSQN